MAPKSRAPVEPPAPSRRDVWLAVTGGLALAMLLTAAAEEIATAFEHEHAGLLLIGVVIVPLAVWLLHRPHRGGAAQPPVRAGANRWSRRLVGARLTAAGKALTLLSLCSLVFVPARHIDAERLRAEVIDHLASTLPNRDAEEVLLRIAKDETTEDRFVALHALARHPADVLRSGELSAILCRLARSSDVDDRYRAMAIASSTAPRELLPPVIMDFAEDGNEWIRQQAIRAMGDLDGLPGSDARAAYLLAIVNSSRATRDVGAAVLALLRIAELRGFEVDAQFQADSKWGYYDARPLVKDAAERAETVTYWSRTLGVQPAPETARIPVLERLLARFDVESRARARTHIEAIRGSKPRPDADPDYSGYNFGSR